MKDLRVKIERKTSMVYPDKDILGLNYENLQGNIIFYFDEFVDGVGWLEIKMPNGTKGYLAMEKVDETYILPIKSSLLAQLGDIYMQLRVTQDENVEGIPVFKSNIFYVTVKESINATATIPDEYPTWIDIANAKILEMDEALAEVDNLDIDAEKIGDTATISITNKAGTTKSVSVSDGKDAKINGVNTLTIEAGTNIGLEQEGSTLTIENTYDDSTITGDISDLKVKDIDLQNQIDAITASSDVVDIVATYSELQNYDTTKLTNDDIVKVLEDSTHSNAVSYYRWVINGTGSWSYIGSEAPSYTKSETDSLLNAKQNKIDNSHKLSADLIDDTNSINKLVTTQEKETWNNKSDFSGDYNDLTNKPDLSVKLDKEDAITMFSNAVVEKILPSKEIEINSAYGYFGKKSEQNELVYDLELLGESTQETTTGKNSLNVATCGFGYIDAQGEIAGNTEKGNILTDYIQVEGGTNYTVSLNTQFTNIGYALFNSSKTYISRQNNNNKSSLTITPNETGYIRLWFNRNVNFDTVDDILAYQPQFEKGSSATSYEPYTGGNPAPSPDYPMEIESITSPVTITSTSGTETNTVTIPLLHPMRSIGTTRDRIYWDNGKWYDEQKTPSVTLNGTENWSMGGLSFYVSITGKKQSSTAISSHFSHSLAWASSDTQYRGKFTANTVPGEATLLKFMPSDDTITTVELWKSWLSTHNVEVIYELETPITTEITDTATIQALESIRTYTGLTEITSDIDIVGSYVKDINEAIPTKTSDLTNDSGYVKDTDYASNMKAGLVRTGTAYKTIAEAETGRLAAEVVTYANYDSAYNNSFISKGTLENVITGKGLVSNTNYATSSTGGVFKTLDDYGTYIINGVLSAVNKNYAQYQVLPNQLFIGKGTLENVITGKELLSSNDVKNNVVSTDTNKPLSANMGKELNDRIQNLASIGKYLAMWDCTTGLPTTNPVTMPYSYTTGDYYVISNVGQTNYMPNGATYSGTSSSTQYSGTDELAVGDFFYYDGTVWTMLKNTGKTVYFANIAGSPMDNSNLANALNGKVGFTDYASNNTGGVIRTGWYNLGITSGHPLALSTTYANYGGLDSASFISKGTLENVLAGRFVTLTQAQYDALVSGGTVDANTYYFIEEE